MALGHLQSYALFIYTYVFAFLVASCMILDVIQYPIREDELHLALFNCGPNAMRDTVHCLSKFAKENDSWLNGLPMMPNYHQDLQRNKSILQAKDERTS
jgi:hypothetical protein